MSKRALLWMLGLIAFGFTYIAAVNVKEVTASLAPEIFGPTYTSCAGLWNPIDWFDSSCAESLPPRLGALALGLAVLIVCGYFAEKETAKRNRVETGQVEDAPADVIVNCSRCWQANSGRDLCSRCGARLPAAGTQGTRYRVIFRAIGNRPEAVQRVLMSQLGYARSGAKGARPGQLLLTSPDGAKAEQLAAAIRDVGGSVEVQHQGDTSPQPPAPPVPEFKTCPDCVEEVRAAARKCRFCGYIFEDAQTPLST